MMKKLMATTTIATMLIAGTFSTAFAETVNHEGNHNHVQDSNHHYTHHHTHHYSNHNSNAKQVVPVPDAAPATAAPVADNSSQADKLIAFAQSLQGKVHYSFGQRVTSNPSNLILDCSSYTQYVYQQSLGIHIPWGSKAQYNAYQHVDKSQLQKGDLLFFSVGTPGQINHVGIYIGNGKFIHNTTGSVHGVTIGDLNSSSYTHRYIGAARVL